MEQATDSEKAMAVSEFLDFKRRNKVFFHQIYLSICKISALISFLIDCIKEQIIKLLAP